MLHSIHLSPKSVDKKIHIMLETSNSLKKLDIPFFDHQLII